MINTEKVIGFYTDVFGNEIDEYEQAERYSIRYFGHLFEGDTDGYNEHGVDDWNKALEFYHTYPDVIEIHDNEYGYTFSKGEWDF